MANEQNLRPGEYKLSKEEAKKGGINSGKARREKATMRKTLEMLLEEKNAKGVTYRELATLGLFVDVHSVPFQLWKIISYLIFP